MTIDFHNIFLRIKPVVLSLWKFFAGGILVAVSFYANFFNLHQPNISVEITEIQQKNSTNFDIGTSPEFTKYRELMYENNQPEDSYYYVNGYQQSMPEYLRIDKIEALQHGLDRKVQNLLDKERLIQSMKERAEKIPNDFKPKEEKDNKRMSIEDVLSEPYENYIRLVLTIKNNQLSK